MSSAPTKCAEPCATSVQAGTLFIVEEASSHFKKEQMSNIFYGGLCRVSSNGMWEILRLSPLSHAPPFLTVHALRVFGIAG